VMAATPDVKRAYEVLQSKATPYSLLWSYYDGEHPLKYTAERLREVFNKLDVKFIENWCAVVIDATMDRINLTGFQVADNEAATDALNDTFVATELNLDSDDAHLAALVCGEAFIIVWKDEEDAAIQAFYNDPRQCHVEYDPSNPRKKLWAAKWWIDAEQRYRLTLYYPDRLEYYVSTKKAENVSSADAFVPAEVPSADNPFGVIPVFHLRRDRRKVQSELSSVLTTQDAVNKLLSDMMVAAEFGAFRQRYVIAQAEPGRLRNAPNEIWAIPGGDGSGQPTSVGEFEQTDLAGYLTAIDKLAAAIAIITRTPKHYMFAQGGDPSGDALVAMEAPLNKKVDRYIERFTATWRKVAAFMAALQGLTIEETDITPLFDNPVTIQPAVQANIRQASVGAGMPLATVLRDEGKDGAYLDQMKKDAQEERQQQQATLAAAMVAAQRRMDQEGADAD